MPRASRWSIARAGRAPPRPSSACKRSNTSGSSDMRRLRSPPKTSGTSADHAHAARAARSTSRAAAAGSCAVACRVAVVRAPCSACARRAQTSRRRSGRRVSVSHRVSTMRHPERTRIWFEPPSPEAIRSGFHSASRRRMNAPTLREVSTDAPDAPAACASARSQCGGASCSSATSHGSRASSTANSSRSGLFTEACSSEPSSEWSRPWKRFQVRTVSAAIYDAQVTQHFLTGEELTSDELVRLLDRAAELKTDRQASRALAGKSVALIFEKPSTRTRISFEVGVHELGGQAVVLREGEMQLSRGESVRDTALVLSRYVAAIGVRTGAHEPVAELAEHASVPIVNMLTADHHPCQALADLLTVKERFGRVDGLRLAYVGDGNNVAHSLMIIAPKAGVEVAVATPAELAPQPVGSARVVTDPAEAVEAAHAVYTDVWVSMGDEDGAAKRDLLEPYRVDEALLARADGEAIALHCLPAHVDEEITAGVLYGAQSAVWDQAENRLHAQKALLELLLAG